MSDVTVPGLRVYGFWTQYKPDPLDAARTIGLDWVEYGNMTDDRTKIRQRVSQLRDCLVPLADAAGNPAVEMAHVRWNLIRPQYEAWKSGQELPEEGTPLGAWNAVSPEQAAVFKQNGVRTVEEIAAFSDAHIQKFSDKIPRLRELVVQAKAFIEAGDQARLARSIEKRDEEIEALKSDNEEMRQMNRALLEKVNALADLVAARQTEAEAEDETADPSDPPVRRRPGRPTNAERAARAGEQAA